MLKFPMYLAVQCLWILGGALAAPPNMVFFIADDISVEDLGCYGHPTIRTPRIDKLAANGLRFDNAYLTTSSCSPSRCSILSGRYPHNTGAPELHQLLPPDQLRFPALLREAGYYTVLSGKNHMVKKGDPAFDQITGGGGPGKEADWVDHVEKRPKNRPFFLWFAAADAHRGWAINDEAPVYANEDAVVPPYLVDTPGTRGDLAKYYHEVSRFDHHVGKVVDAIREQGELDNTLVVVAADNGRPFPRCKTRLYDSGIETPWVVHYPDAIERPGTTDSLVSAIDLGATCLELAGIDRPAAMQGRSFLPILEDPEAVVREVVFAEHNWHVYKNHERMVRFGDYLYIRNNFPNQANLCYEAHNDPAGVDLWEAQAAGTTTPAQQGLFANPCPPEELFRVGSDDPHQLNNLVADSAHAEALATARKLLAAWTEQTGDTVPENPTPNRHDPPRIVDGTIVRDRGKGAGRTPFAEKPGASRNAFAIHHPGPIGLGGPSRVFLVGNSLTWDTVPSRLDGVVKWHVDCGKNLPFIREHPDAPCVKSSIVWNKALRAERFDLLSVQPHYGSTIEQDVETISAWMALQPEAVVVLHSGWAHHETRADEYGQAETGETLQHSRAHFDALVIALQKEHPDRTFRRTRAQDLLAMAAKDAAAGRAPVGKVSDLYRDAIHMKVESGRYLMHNAMRRALGQARSAAGFEKTTPEMKAWLDSLLDRLDAEP